MKFRHKHLVSINDLSKEEILYILSVAEKFEKKSYPEMLKGKILATLFFEPSTRTRLSFTSSMMKLGGNVMGFDTESGTSREKGTGLGLRLCYELVQLHNGDLRIESVKDKGTTVKISLPT